MLQKDLTNVIAIELFNVFLLIVNSLVFALQLKSCITITNHKYYNVFKRHKII